MSPEAQRIAIAGLFFDKVSEKPGRSTVVWMDGDLFGTRNRIRQKIPDYPSDLSAMHEAEKVLAAQQRIEYWNWLIAVCACSEHHFSCATAAQRSEAFLRCLNLWSHGGKET